MGNRIRGEKANFHEWDLFKWFFLVYIIIIM